MSKAAKRKRKRERKEDRITLKHKCIRCGNSLPKGQDMCESCAELQGDFRARPGVTNDELVDGFPRPLQVWEGGTEGSHTAACDGEDHPGRPCPIDYP